MARPREFDIDTVLDQSMNVFWEKGFTATSLEDLTDATSIKKQSLYCAFGDKHSLFLKALSRYRQKSFSMIKSLLNDSDSALAGIENLFLTIVSWWEEGTKGCLMVNSTFEFGTDDPEVHAELQSMFAGFEKFVEQAIQRGQAEGQITRTIESCLLSKSLINTLGGLSILRKRGESVETLQALMKLALASLRA